FFGQDWHRFRCVTVVLNTPLQRLLPVARAYATRFSLIHRHLGVLFLLCSLMAVRAQETVRMSLASAQAAEARRRAAATIGYYNLKVRPTAWRFGAGLGLEYNDNIVLREENQEGDFIFRPQINAQMLWPI